MRGPPDPSVHDWLSTAQVAERLGVSPATVKRWAEAGVLRCERTAGGHRRFGRERVEQLRRSGAARPGGEPASPLDDDVPREARCDAWIDLLLSPSPALAVEVALLETRGRLGSWLGVAERFDPVLVALGERWATGALTVLEEHLASARLSRALAWVSDTLPVGNLAPLALLATVAPEEHTLGLSLVELCLREAGWRTQWAGRRTPLEDLEGFAASGSATALLVSASVCSEAPVLRAAAARLGPAARQGGTALVVGGRGPWPEPFAWGERLHELRELRAWAERAAR